ncbi:phosphatidate cytidylyltransferase [Plantactinospora siamensis]|uniref:Phosphatidate cytidylyltransferase n=1 Tax=Plantactinospora siamensis TaxID=555372 RepID=A0ABV6NSV5_9ACTN
MSYLDPHGSAEPRDWDNPDVPSGSRWPDPDAGSVRARHPGAAPEPYPWPGPPAGAAAGRTDPAGPAGLTDPVGLPPVPADPAGLTGLTDPVGLPPLAAPPPAGPRPVPPVPADPGADPGRPRRHRGRRRATRSAARTGQSPSTGTSAGGASGPPVVAGPEDAGPPARTGRAGRNLPAAVGVGLGLGAAIVVPLFYYRPAFLAVLAIAVGIGIWEMVRAIQRSGVNPPMLPLIVGGVAMLGLAWWAGPDALSLGLLVTVLAVLVWRLGDGPAGYQRDMTGAVLVAVYVPFLAGFAALLAVPPDGHFRVLVTLAGVVLSDTGGYAAGVWLGRHPMAPSVSPKKSWEGFGGSVVAAGLGSAVLLWTLLGVAPWWGALFGVAVSGAAVLGDLGESMIKRDLGVKDMSNLLPGHGGLMDRLDSVLFAVPVAYLLLSVLKPAG